MNDDKSPMPRSTWRNLLRSVSTFMKSEVGGRARMFLAILLVLMLCINGMNVLNSYVGRYFMSAIEMRDFNGFAKYAWLYVAVFAGSTTVAVLFRFAEERLGLLWRDWLTHRIVSIYLDQRVYLHLEAEGGLSNPDQRMTEDVKQLTVSTLSFLLMILNGTVTAISFSGVLWSISPTLFIVAVLYAAVGSAFTILLGRPLINLNYKQADYEANFRSELIRVRENADGIALSGHQDSTRGRLMNLIDQLVANFRRITAVNRNLNFFTSGYNYMIQLIPTLIVAPLFMRHGVEFGVIGQSAMAFATLLAAFSLIITQFQAISSYASVVTRLGEFVDATEKAAIKGERSCIKCTSDSDRFTFVNLTLRAKDKEGTILLKDLQVSFDPGCRVRIFGLNQNARFALFRTSAGLYDTGSGSITRPPPEKLAFMPEQPYFPPGTIRELLIPARDAHNVTNEDIARLFAEIGLVSSSFKSPVEFEIAHNWQEMLSLRKLQLMSVARAVLAKPRYVLLDRMETTLGSATLELVLAVLAKHGITYISFGDDPPEPNLYDAALEIRNDGTWDWKSLR